MQEHTRVLSLKMETLRTLEKRGTSPDVILFSKRLALTNKSFSAIL